MIIHPLVRDLYKRALVAAKDYPVPFEKTKALWKKAIQNPDNCPSCYDSENRDRCEKEIKRAVAKGRAMEREMIGIIRLKKYRAMKKRY